jgi:hypothetical protein
MPLQRPLHLQVVAVRRGKEVGAHEKEDDGCAVQMLVDRAGPLLPGADLSVVPVFDETLTPQNAQVRAEPLSKPLILVAVGDKILIGPCAPA